MLMVGLEGLGRRIFTLTFFTYTISLSARPITSVVMLLSPTILCAEREH